MSYEDFTKKLEDLSINYFQAPKFEKPPIEKTKTSFSTIKAYIQTNAEPALRTIAFTNVLALFTMGLIYGVSKSSKYYTAHFTKEKEDSESSLAPIKSEIESSAQFVFSPNAEQTKNKKIDKNEQKHTKYSDKIVENLQKIEVNLEKGDYTEVLKNKYEINKYTKKLEKLSNKVSESQNPDLANKINNFWGLLENKIQYKAISTTSQEAGFFSSVNKSPAEIGKEIQKYSARIADLENKGDIDNKEEILEHLEAVKKLYWNALLQKIDSNSDFKDLLPRDQNNINDDLDELLLNLANIKKQISSITDSSDTVDMRDLTSYYEHLNRLIGNVKKTSQDPSGNPAEIVSKIAEIAVAVQSLNIEVQAIRKVAAEHLNALHKKAISDLGLMQKVLSDPSSDADAIKEVAVKLKIVDSKKTAALDTVVDQTLSLIELIAGSINGDKQAQETLTSLRKNPLTKGYLDQASTRVDKIVNVPSSWDENAFITQLIGSPQNAFQDEFLLVYREVMQDKFFTGLTEQGSSARLFEWLNQVYENRPMDQQMQILEFAKKWLSYPDINAEDHSTSAVKTQLDNLIDIASKSQFSQVRVAAKELKEASQIAISDSKTALPRDGDQSLSEILNKLPAMSKDERKKAVKMVAADLSSYSGALFLNLRSADIGPKAVQKPDQSSPDLQALTDYSNHLTELVINEILKRPTLEEARILVEFFGEVRNKLLEPDPKDNNQFVDFNSAMAIEGAFSSAPVSRLGTEDRPIAQLKIAIPEGNYIAYRQLLSAKENSSVIPAMIIHQKEVFMLYDMSTSINGALNVKKLSNHILTNRLLFLSQSKIRSLTSFLNTDLAKQLDSPVARRAEKQNHLPTEVIDEITKMKTQILQESNAGKKLKLQTELDAYVDKKVDNSIQKELQETSLKLRPRNV